MHRQPLPAGREALLRSPLAATGSTAEWAAAGQREPPRSAYIHVPFCGHRCGYCNFSVVAGRDDLMDRYLAALRLELERLASPREVDTLFVGGGTPTRLDPPRFTQFCELIRDWFPVAPGAEFSIEANPLDVTPGCVESLAAAGVTRVSLGVQSFQPHKLATLERDHRADDVLAGVRLLRRLNVALSLDLIFGVPGETVADWQADLEAALEFEPQHLSLYGLTFERGTAFWSRRRRGQLTACDELLEREMYLAGVDRLSRQGLVHYEVSNFAQAGFACRHHLVYWDARPYFAAGPGAARYVHGVREVNHRSTSTWIKRLCAGQSPVFERECLGPEDRAREALVLGLRRLGGVSKAEFAARFGVAVEELFGTLLASLTDQGLLQDDGTTLRLSREGLLVSDAIWPGILRC